MRRYVRRPTAYIFRDSDDVWHQPQEGNRESITVSEPEREPTFSGLYDAEGAPLFRQETRPMGFLWRDE